MTTSIAKKAGNTSIIGDNRAYSNGGSGENKHGNGETTIARGRASFKKPICYEYG